MTREEIEKQITLYREEIWDNDEENAFFQRMIDNLNMQLVDLEEMNDE